jgi:hypothetical protein
VQNYLAFGTSLRVPDTPAFIIEKSDGSNPDYLPGAYPFFSCISGVNRQKTYWRLIAAGGDR